jgi:hypothetical protein
MSKKSDALTVAARSTVLTVGGDVANVDPDTQILIAGPGGLMGTTNPQRIGDALIKQFVKSAAAPAYRLIGDEFAEQVRNAITKAKGEAAARAEAARSEAAKAAKAAKAK